eukprot:TRINITY_DN162_c1_g1_i1.p1 TRINITY_DN162_c1_g1~~TRINITY_DN162_c1_g1_i1.p1  ORF type:complete len:277 (+),score=115.24 TRINITY_DN162_c1_g1_i1:97-927(+)
MATEANKSKTSLAILKEIKKLVTNDLFNGQATFDIPNTDDPFTIHLLLLPKEGYFKGGKVTFRLNLPENYPNARPGIFPVSLVWHPNISFENNYICFSMFTSDWDPQYRLEHYANGLLWLLSNPNFGDPCFRPPVNNRATYSTDVIKSLNGATIHGFRFTRSVFDEELFDTVVQSMNPPITSNNGERRTSRWVVNTQGLARPRGLNTGNVYHFTSYRRDSQNPTEQQVQPQPQPQQQQVQPQIEQQVQVPQIQQPQLERINFRSARSFWQNRINQQ